ncbi:hypothetical protein NR402_00285 [Acidithiobacillus ferrooxidans]|uniref:hypothetical protein n=1 Tax=Acidithiobacillus ferrooxidans TaxID=920 RepID=UPI001EF3B190|nr:hypothetical protein [Acidithiobacillus ferrooxidans]MCR2828727.1 hypothetical protein [Acidithiobacillus ferrooxidans]
MLTIRKLPLAVAIGVLGFSACSHVQAATEGLPFKIVAYDATYTLHPNGSYTARIHEVTSPLRSATLESRNSPRLIRSTLPRWPICE